LVLGRLADGDSGQFNINSNELPDTEYDAVCHGYRAIITEGHSVVVYMANLVLK